MGNQYAPKRFFREIDLRLLRRYLEHVHLEHCLQLNAKGTVDPTATLKAIDELPPSIRRRIDADFSLVTEMAGDNGSVLIQDHAQFWRLPWAARLVELKNGHERALLALLEDRDRFEDLAGQIEMDRFADSRWWRRLVGKNLEHADDDAAIGKLQAAVQRVFESQGRGRRCHIDYSEGRDPVRFCYHAYPEDLPKTDPGYDDQNEFGRQVRRTALEVIFRYQPDIGRLDMIAPGNQQLKEEMAAAFCLTILNLPSLPEATDKPPYNLNVLRERSFEFLTEPVDNIERVELRMLRFDLPGGSNRRLSISARPHRDEDPLLIYDVLDDVLDTTRLPLSALEVSQAQISMKFKGKGGARGKCLTFEVTHPDRCNLKDHAHDLIAKRYLTKWGIAHD